MGGKKDPEKKLSYDINSILEKAKSGEDVDPPKRVQEKPEERIEKVDDLVEGDFEVVDEGDDERMGEKDEAIQSYIRDLETDLDEKIAALDAEKDRRASVEAEVDELKKQLDKAQKENEADETVQGYLGDLEADLKVKVDELEQEKGERERLEKEIAQLKSSIEESSKSQKELTKLRSELEKARADGDVEVAKLENDLKRREQEMSAHKTRVQELEEELQKKISLIDEMGSKVAETEASVIDNKERIKALEAQLDSERKKAKAADGRALDLSEELKKMRDTLSMKVEEVEKAKTDLHTLEAMKKRLDDASTKLDQESQERVRAESEIGKLRGNLSDILQNMENDLARSKLGHEQAIKDLEAERERRAGLEKELAAIRASVEASSSETQKELLTLRTERDRLVKESEEKQRALDAEMSEVEELKSELAKQRQALEQERHALQIAKSRIEKEHSDQSSEYTMKDVQIRTERESLMHEKEQSDRKGHELTEKEKRLAERERAVKQKENRIRSEMRAKALGLEPQPPEEPPEPEVPEEEPAVESKTPEPKVEEPVEPVPEAPRIWPPLGSQRKVEKPAEPAQEAPIKMGLPSTYLAERREEERPAKKTKRQLAWPDHAYEAEARLKNVAYGPSREEGGSTAGTRRLIDNYVIAKSEPSSRPRERVIRCVCGTEFYASTNPTSAGIVCPKCGRRLA